MEQLTFEIDLLTPLVNERAASETLEERFHRFHKRNPHVYRAIVRVARQLKDAGWKSASIAMVFERLRWLYGIRTRGDNYCLNNSYRAFYSRLVMDLEPDLDGFFQTRHQPTQDTREEE